MNVKVAIGMWMSVSGTALAHITIGPAPTKPQAPLELFNTNQPSINLTNKLTDTNLVLNLPSQPMETPKPLLKEPSPSGIGPGAYVTKPFSCIVIVPGAQADDCIIPATIPPGSIPNAKPMLKFKPLPSADGM